MIGPPFTIALGRGLAIRFNLIMLDSNVKPDWRTVISEQISESFEDKNCILSRPRKKSGE